MHAHAMTPPPPCFTDEVVCLGSFAVPFFSTFLLSHHLDKGSSLSHRTINTVPKLFWLTFVLFANSNLAFLFLVLVRGLHIAVILCQSHLRTVDCQSISFLEVVGDFTDMSLGIIFTAFMICLSSTTVVFSADQVVVGCWWFPNS